MVNCVKVFRLFDFLTWGEGSNSRFYCFFFTFRLFDREERVQLVDFFDFFRLFDFLTLRGGPKWTILLIFF